MLDIATVGVPETLIDKECRRKFAVMLSEFAEQGTPDSEIKEMCSEENLPKNLEKYRKVSGDRTLESLKSGPQSSPASKNLPL